jgi:peptidoglycan/LPS O-acetylase OafA/YrhL
MTLAKLDFRSNGIGFIRLLLAAIVVWSHAWAIAPMGYEPLALWTNGSFTAGFLAVCGFFVLSGFLITKSGELLHDPGRFLWHRVLRIYPGFWVCLVVTAFVVAPSMYRLAHGTLHGYFSSPEGPLSYFFQNLLVFDSQGDIANLATRFNHHLNSSLWTLPWEFACYFGVAAFGMVGIYRSPRIVAMVTLLLIGIMGASESVSKNGSYFQYMMPLFLFISFGLGSTAYLFRDRIPIRWPLAIAAGVWVVAALPGKFDRTLVAVPMAYLTLYAAMRLPICSFDRKADLSYGLYIYSMPISYLLAYAGFTSFGFPVYCAIAMVSGLIVAALSWFIIEQNALQLKNATFRLRSPRRSSAPSA